MRGLNYIGLPHYLLSVASLTPMTAPELLTRVEARYGHQDCAEDRATKAVAKLVRLGYLRWTAPHPGAGRPAPPCVITPKGEAELDRLYSAGPSRSALYRARRAA